VRPGTGVSVGLGGGVDVASTTAEGVTVTVAIGVTVAVPVGVAAYAGVPASLGSVGVPVGTPVGTGVGVDVRVAGGVAVACAAVFVGDAVGRCTNSTRLGLSEAVVIASSSVATAPTMSGSRGANRIPLGSAE
jgi:hypothetical protein